MRRQGLSDGVTVIGDNAAATATLNLSGGKLTTKTLLKGRRRLVQLHGRRAAAPRRSASTW